MKIAIFPGSFNPPHMGHLYIALDVYYEFKLDLIYFVPSKKTINKKHLSDSTYHRFNMVKMSISDIPFFKISDFEIKQNGISYTFKTIKYFKERFKLKKEDLFLIIGQDWINRFTQWKNYEYILENCNLICVSRNEIDIFDYNYKKSFYNNYNNLNSNVVKKEIVGCDKKYDYFLLNSYYDISSTKIRNLIHKRKYFKIYLKENVYYYIVNNGLYL